MNQVLWIFLPILILFLTELQTQHKQKYIIKRIKAYKGKGSEEMSEIIKRFIGKECFITTLSENVIGIVEAVEDHWIVVSPTKNKLGGTEIINIDYISRIRESPKFKMGNKNPIIN